MFELMVEKLAHRKEREAEAMKGRSNRVVSDEQFFREAGIKRKVNRGN
jgi:hypothetical protein